jgi:Family of unknown function (DUF5709)
MVTGIGDSADSDGEPIDDPVGDSRAGRLVAFGFDPTDPTTDYRAHEVRIDGGAASTEERPCPSNDSEILFTTRNDILICRVVANFSCRTCGPTFGPLRQGIGTSTAAKVRDIATDTAYAAVSTVWPQPAHRSRASARQPATPTRPYPATPRNSSVPSSCSRFG